MAYVSQEMKKELAPAIKAVLKKYGFKGTIGVQHHSALVVKIKGGTEIVEEYIKTVGEDTRAGRGEEIRSDAGRWGLDVNEYWTERYGKYATFFEELVEAMKGPKYFCEDDMMTDYFHRSHYTYVRVFA